MESKYYTPTIEELISFILDEKHIYASVVYSEDLIELKFGDNPLNELLYTADMMYEFSGDCTTPTQSVRINPELFRIKYLDKEDIESLGFKYYKKGWGSGSLIFRSNRGEGLELYFRDDYPLQISKANGLILFEGFIKNKSELKKLLTQLGIC